MPGPAQVRSTQAIETFDASVAKFEEQVQNALDALVSELQRTENWIEHDRPAYWRTQLHKAEDGVHQAKLELERCLLFALEGERRSCREQKVALEAAKRRVEYCREKSAAVKRWQANFRQEALEFRGRIGQLRRAVESDLPQARGVLKKILRRIEEYQIERPPEAFAAHSRQSNAEPTASNPEAVPSPSPECTTDAG
jgi:hypothetical protein